MSDKFRIWREQDHDSPSNLGFWALDYPTGFDESLTGELFSTFDEAVAAFIENHDRWCLMGCGRNTVVDTLTGWECTSCGASDTASPALGGPR